MADEEDTKPKLRTVDKTQNSAVLGKYISQKFNDKYEKSINDASGHIMRGFEYIFQNNDELYAPKIIDMFFKVFMVMCTVVVNVNEIEFKRRLFIKLLAKLQPNSNEKTKTGLSDDSKHDNVNVNDDNMLRPPRRRTQILLDKNLLSNTDNHLLSNTENHLLSNIITKCRTIVFNKMLGGGPDDPAKSSQMRCFLSQKTENIINQYMESNLEYGTVRDEIMYRLQDAIQQKYSQFQTKLIVCQAINKNIVALIDNVADKILDMCAGRELETFYVLMEDDAVQGFIRTIGKKNHDLKNACRYIDNNKDKVIVSEIIIDVLKDNMGDIVNDNGMENTDKILSDPAPTMLDKLNYRLSELLYRISGPPPKKGGGDNLSPMDYYIDDILADIASDIYDKIKDNVNTLDSTEITEIMTTAINGYLDDMSIDNTAKTNNIRVVGHMFDCLFGFLNDKMKLHLMYVYYFPNEETRLSVQKYDEPRLKDAGKTADVEYKTKIGGIGNSSIESYSSPNKRNFIQLGGGLASESVIFGLPNNKIHTPADNTLMANRNIYDIVIAPFYQEMESEDFQKAIVGTMNRHMTHLSEAIAGSIKDNTFSDLLNAYIFKTGSITHTVIERAKRLCDHLTDKDKPTAISFTIFYLLKKYLYWGKYSVKLGIPINMNNAYVRDTIGYVNMNHYTGEFNTYTFGITKSKISTKINIPEVVGIKRTNYKRVGDMANRSFDRSKESDAQIELDIKTTVDKAIKDYESYAKKIIDRLKANNINFSERNTSKIIENTIKKMNTDKLQLPSYVELTANNPRNTRVIQEAKEYIKNNIKTIEADLKKSLKNHVDALYKIQPIKRVDRTTPEEKRAQYNKSRDTFGPRNPKTLNNPIPPRGGGSTRASRRILPQKKTRRVHPTKPTRKTRKSRPIRKSGVRGTRKIRRVF